MADKYNTSSVGKSLFVKLWSEADSFYDFSRNWEPSKKHVEKADEATKSKNKTISSSSTLTDPRHYLDAALKLRRSNINKELLAMHASGELDTKLELGKKSDMKRGGIKKDQAVGWARSGMLSVVEEDKKKKGKKDKW